MSVAAGIQIPRDLPFMPYRPEGAKVTAGQTFNKGWSLMRSAAGLLQVATEVPGLLPGGFADRDLLTADPGNNDFVNAETGIYSVDMSQLTGDYFLDTDGPLPIYAVDNQLFGKLAVNPSTGAARSIAGCFLRLDRALYTANASQQSKCLAWVGPEGVAMAQGIVGNGLVAPTYRAVITSIAAYAGTTTGTLTASATGAIGAQDGITLVAGDRVFLPKVTGGAGGTTAAADTGPWIVVNPGSASPAAKFVLTRPPEFYHGAKVPESFTVKIGSEGTNMAGWEWRAFPTTASKVIDTDDPVFYPRVQPYEYTIGTGLVAGGGLGNAAFYLRQADSFTSTNKTGAHAFWASTITAGDGNGALVFTGTSSDVIVGQAINF